MDETTPLSSTPGPRVLVGRYTLRGLLGQGGMADVELAHDEVLDREVAVKLLHLRYTDDPSFVERFKREARATASLNHPNMVAVYDTGESEGRPFIVMEYVRGRTLRDVLRSEQLLPGRAAEMAADAALALHYAHDRGLVHRDVKPANIMLSNEGQVKVTDFGIARAVGAETVTQTAAVFGTAAYIAPEQAQGGAVDRRTDIYALGVVLYEMLTGRQPFTAESPVALAYKHISEDPIRPSQINDDVSPELEAVVLRAMAKNPDNRYPDARAFHDDLQRAVAGEAVSAPPVMAGYATTQVIRRDPDRTLVAPRPVEEEPYEPRQPRRGNRSVGYVMLFLLLLAALGAGLYFLTRALAPQPVAEVQVPDVVGEPAARAQRLVQAEGLDTRIERTEDADADENTVISTDPPAGATVEEGATVLLLVSEGPPLVEVPELVGLTEAEAIQAIQDAQLSVGERLSERSDDTEAGRVLRTSPDARSQVEQGEAVDYVVAAGPATVEIPAVDGRVEGRARDELINACETPPCVTITVERQFSDDISEGRAIGTDPGAGTRVEFGADVTLFISQGPEPEPEPSATTPSPTETEATETEATEATEVSVDDD